LVDGYAGDVCGQQITGELDARKIEPQHACQGAGQSGLADARDVFDEQMPIGKQTGQREIDLLGLAKNDLVQCFGCITQLRAKITTRRSD